MDEETKIFPDLFSLGNEMNMRWNETWKGFTQHHMGESPEPGTRLLSLPAVSPAAERQHDGRAEGLEWEMGKNLTPLLAESLWAHLPCLVINTVWAFPGNHTNVRVVRKFKVRSWMQKHLAHLLPPPPLHEKRFQSVIISLITEHPHYQMQGLLRGCPIPDTVLRAAPKLSLVTATWTFWGIYYFYWIDEKTEIWESK